jgi:hypothetical protein
MKKILIEDMIDICNIMYNKIEDGYESVCFVGMYDDAKVLIRELLLTNDNALITLADIEPEAFYNKEYVISLDNEMNIWCEKAYDYEDECYLWIEDNCALVADDCSSAVLKTIESKEIYEVGYDLDDECKCGCCRAENQETITRVATDDSGNIRGFEKSWSTRDGNMNYHTTYSFFSNNQSMLKDMLDNFDIKF